MPRDNKAVLVGGARMDGDADASGNDNKTREA